MKNIPKLRFNEYKDEWKTKKIGDILTIKSGKDQKQIECEGGQYPIYGTGGIIGYGSDFLTDKPCVCIGRKGTIDKPIYLDKPFWTVDTLFYSECKLNNNPRFQYNLFQTINWYKYNEASGVPSLSRSTIESINVKIPLLKEQEKIAKFLSKVDEKINMLSNKIDNLDLYKKGLIQYFIKNCDKRSMFVKDVFDITRGNVVAKSTLSEEQTELNCYPYYSSQTLNNGLMGWGPESLFDGNMLTWTTDGANAGKVFYRKEKFNCSNVCGVLIPKEGYEDYSNAFTAEYMNTITKRYVSFVGNPKLMNNVMANIKLELPSIDYITKFGNYLEKLNNKLSKLEKQCNSLKLFKKGLLQQMFV